jgi:class 3 adenylate cyclase/esterase/lipase
MAESPQTRFVQNGDVHLAYQVVGSGPIDLLLIDTWVHHVDLVWDVTDFARLLRRLSSFARLIHFDRRGTGLSDSVPNNALPDLETQVEDVIAVLDAAGSERPAVLGVSDGNLVAMLLAATHPDRCRSLVLYAPAGLQAVTADHPLGWTHEAIEEAVQVMTDGSVKGDSGLPWLAPSRIGDERFDEQLKRLQRSSVRPSAFGHFYRQSMLSDIRPVLPTIQAPTLVIHRTDDRIIPIELGREVAALIPGAKFVELPGTDALLFSGDTDGVVEEVEEFLTGARTGDDFERALATLVFTDIVDSTSVAAEVGDRRWRDLLDRHDELVRRELDRFRGREIVTTGDGFLVAFDGPGRAVRCARSITAAAASLGVQVRAGVHTGEVDLRGTDVGGLAVHIAARVASLAAPGEVLVSSTVKDLLVGSGIVFEGRGEHALKGVPDTWRLFAATREGDVL